MLINHSGTRGKSRWYTRRVLLARVRRKRGGRCRAGGREKAKFLVDALAPDACNTYVHCFRRRRRNRRRVHGRPVAAVVSSHTWKESGKPVGEEIVGDPLTRCGYSIV